MGNKIEKTNYMELWKSTKDTNNFGGSVAKFLILYGDKLDQIIDWINKQEDEK